MYTIFSAVLRQQRKSDVMTYFGHSSRSAVYYKAGSQLEEICCPIGLSLPQTLEQTTTSAHSLKKLRYRVTLFG
jgi:hypothetical protein